ncbi:hypothetical protein OAR19_00015 [bacterium]|nr:hypothetical protein [bacterium]
MSKSKIVRFFSWQVLLGLSLVVVSIAIYYFHFVLFHDAHHIFIYLVGDIAFVPIEVLIVTLIIHQVLNSREKRAKLKKLNMVIGAFFSEVGTDLISFYANFDPQSKEIQEKLLVDNKWTKDNFMKTKSCMQGYNYAIKINKREVVKLREFLIKKRSFLLRLLENPNLLEHDTFTDLLWSVFHLTDELMHRKKISRCSKNDLEHIENDIKRSYCLLIKEWLVYLQHLQADYPYLYSLAVRINPFNTKMAVEFN